MYTVAASVLRRRHMSQLTRQQVIDDLRQQLSKFEATASSCFSSDAEGGVSTGVQALDRLLPGRGLVGGTLLEWVSVREGSGAASLSLALASRLQRQGGIVVVVDERREFCPPAAAALGMVLERTLVVQPRHKREVLWTWEQALRSPAVAGVVGGFETIHDRIFRRLQLAAEAGGGVGFLLRPISCRGEPSWAAARLLVEPLPSGKRLSPIGRRLRIELLHGRGGTAHKSIELELSDEANDVHSFSAVADSAAARRAAGA
jgi:protein ImuA